MCEAVESATSKPIVVVCIFNHVLRIVQVVFLHVRDEQYLLLHLLR